MKNRLKEERTNQGKSQGDLASYCDVTRQTIYAIESQKLKPTVYLALAICEFLSVKVEDIFLLESSNE